MRHLRGDDGVTLSELVVVLGLLGMILAISWLGFSVASGGSRVADRASMSAREVSFPLLQCERLLIQQRGFLTGSLEGLDVDPTPSRVAFMRDLELDGRVELVIIEATDDGKLTIKTAEEPDDPSVALVWSTVVWSTYNKNKGLEDEYPLFTFYAYKDDAMGRHVEVEVDPDDAASDAQSVKITIAAEHDGRLYSDSRTVSFRNR